MSANLKCDGCVNLVRCIHRKGGDQFVSLPDHNPRGLKCQSGKSEKTHEHDLLSATHHHPSASASRWWSSKSASRQ